MKIFKIIGIILLVLLLVLLILPYVIPVPASKYSDANAALQANSQDFKGKFLQIAGKQVYVEDFNSQSPKVITFIHGFGGSTFSWRGNKDFFVNQGYRVIALDLPGFGLSATGFTENYSHPVQAEALKQILNSLGITKTDIVAHSMGANVALHFVQSYPALVNKLVLVDGAVVTKQSANPLLGSLNLDPIRRWGKLLLAWYFDEANFGKFLKSAFVAPDLVTAKTVAGYYLPSQITDWQDRLLAITRDSGPNALKKPLSELNVPTFIVWGAQDPWINPSEGASLQSQIKSSELIEIQNAGHLPFEEQPELFNEAVLTFLK
jgi:pimeloyl-ACP methyl ester carboxylesterase